MSNQYSLIDIGPNLAHDSFDSDLSDVLQRARQAGVAQMIVTGSDAASAHAACTLANKYPGQLYATAGLHPHHAQDLNGDILAQFRELAEQPNFVALGEMGLDFFRDISPRVQQESAFKQQLELAVELKRPVFLHQREAHARFLPILKDYMPNLPGAVVHCFTGSGDELADYIELGCHIGITGWICDERRGKHLWDVVHLIPDNRLMIETDSPYLMPRTIRPKPKTRRNEPCNLPYVLATLADARKQSQSSLAQITTNTARKFFSLDTI